MLVPKELKIMPRYINDDIENKIKGKKTPQFHNGPQFERAGRRQEATLLSIDVDQEIDEAKEEKGKEN